LPVKGEDHKNNELLFLIHWDDQESLTQSCIYRLLFKRDVTVQQTRKTIFSFRSLAASFDYAIPEENVSKDSGPTYNYFVGSISIIVAYLRRLLLSNGSVNTSQQRNCFL
jgi:hypothetical protein